MTEINTDDFLETIRHAEDRNHEIEEATCKAIAIDGANGLACFLEYRDGEISKVDYCDIKNDKVQLIELSDLSDTIGNLKLDIAREISESKQEEGFKKKNEKEIIDIYWTPIVMEFQLKVQGSMCVIERLYRTNAINNNPIFQLLIVCKNNTDILILDLLRNQLRTRLRGMVGRGIINICITRRICQELISTR